MGQYTVCSGQNIYDIALTIHGSVEGIFDLLASNDWLTMDTKLLPGSVLNYNNEFIVNQNIALWLKNKDVVVKNGEHTYQPFNAENLIKEHIQNNHIEDYNSILALAPEKRKQYWELKSMPRMIIKQQGQLSLLRFSLKSDSHLIIDWGDYSSPQLIDEAEEQEAEHCYKGNGTHVITLYGDFKFNLLDLREINGIYYPLGIIQVDKLETDLKIDNLNKLFVIQ